jgi:hypothetical protein
LRFRRCRSKPFGWPSIPTCMSGVGGVLGGRVARDLHTGGGVGGVLGGALRDLRPEYRRTVRAGGAYIAACECRIGRPARGRWGRRLERRSGSTVLEGSKAPRRKAVRPTLDKVDDALDLARRELNHDLVDLVIPRR